MTNQKPFRSSLSLERPAPKRPCPTPPTIAPAPILPTLTAANVTIHPSLTAVTLTPQPSTDEEVKIEEMSGDGIEEDEDDAPLDSASMVSTIGSNLPSNHITIRTRNVFIKFRKMNRTAR